MGQDVTLILPGSKADGDDQRDAGGNGDSRPCQALPGTGRWPTRQRLSRHEVAHDCLDLVEIRVLRLREEGFQFPFLPG